eukprot:CAMPEP_0169448506 /NCGR_PEP_ID=MMETSP1042-20121227/12084_1 /TAXON_ID=464988 /ORGANISM="Hemiselmis andersenii, Strain CCMP1180" /LENGTH=217 /DNA_ID=CAMNT_0009560123 /DNA_START=444 /DNA_END=1098 /DNA_ORIENTATION=+
MCDNLVKEEEEDQVDVSRRAAPPRGVAPESVETYVHKGGVDYQDHGEEAAEPPQALEVVWGASATYSTLSRQTIERRRRKQQNVSHENHTSSSRSSPSCTTAPSTTNLARARERSRDPILASSVSRSPPRNASCSNLPANSREHIPKLSITTFSYHPPNNLPQNRSSPSSPATPTAPALSPSSSRTAASLRYITATPAATPIAMNLEALLMPNIPPL